MRRRIFEVDERRAVLDVPEVELDPLGPRQRGATVDLRPAREPGPDVEALALALVVLLDLVAERGTRADDAHVTAEDVPELRQLVDRRPTQEAPEPRDPRIPLVDRVPGAHRLRSHDHRPELQQLEVLAFPADAHLAVEDRPAVLELDRERGETEQRAREHEPRAGDRDVERAVHRVPRALSQVCGVPVRR